MKGKRFSEEQIIGILKEAEGGLAVKDLCRQHGIAEGTYYRWKSKYGGLEVSEAKRLRTLEDENRRLKTIVADLTLENKVLRDVNSKKW
jgi:putative transposase|tara:strand:- start:145 stop:411 length:267 start_codon:yes stop_codon:yes gene_type:complete